MNLFEVAAMSSISAGLGAIILRDKLLTELVPGSLGKRSHFKIENAPKSKPKSVLNKKKKTPVLFSKENSGCSCS